MPVLVDKGLLEHARGSSGGFCVEVRGAGDPAAAAAGLELARGAVLGIPHPEQPDEPFASLVAEVVAGERGPSIELDMADAEAYDGVLEQALGRVVACLELAGVGEGCLTWPGGTCERAAEWRGPRGGEGAVEAVAAWAPAAPARPGPPNRPATPRFPPAPGGWSTWAPIPTPRVIMSATPGANGRVYVIGGELGVPVRAVDAYDPAADRWEPVAPLRVARRGPGAALGPDGRVYAIGGYGARRGGANTAEAYDPDAGRWEEIAPMRSRIGCNEVGAAAGPGGLVYAAGFVDGTRADHSPCPHYLKAYDPARDEWAELAPPPTDWYHGDAIPALVAAAGRLYLLAERVYGADSVTVGAYDPSRDAWQRVASPSTPRHRFGAALGRDGRIYVVGGGRSRIDLVATVEAYDPARDRWEVVAPLPTPRFPAVAACPDGSILAVAGCDEDRLLDVVEAYLPRP